MVRPSPDRDWDTAFRENPVKKTDDYKKLMEELQDRELTPEDYDILLSLEQKQSCISLEKFLAIAFEKAYPPPAAYYSYPKVYCTFCESEIIDR